MTIITTDGLKISVDNGDDVYTKTCQTNEEQSRELLRLIDDGGVK